MAPRSDTAPTAWPPVWMAVWLLLALTPALSAQPADAPAEAAESAEETTAPEEAADAPEAEGDWMTAVDQFFGTWLVTPLYTVLFYEIPTGDWSDGQGNEHQGLPLVVVWLFLGATYLTIRMGFINVRAFWHAIRVTKGDFDNPDDPGEVSHFQALASALSATVGLGNIGSVAVAVSLGGPGAIFWMVMCGLLGMTSKFTECTLGQMYRKVLPDGTVLGGPMRYLSVGLAELGVGPLGAVLAVVFSVLCVGASLGGGCAFQVSQSMLAVNSAIVDAFSLTAEQAEAVDSNRWIYGVILAVLVGIVILGGIRRIAATAEKIVPLMCLVYVLMALAVLVMNYGQIDDAFATIWRLAWAPESAYGGVVGAAILGIQRAAFSNEAGVGSAAIAHSAARTEHPAREGIVALLEPFIDTVLICTMTGLTIVITGAYTLPEAEGAEITSQAFGGEVRWFAYVLAVATMLFAYSTMISWSYYGERCATFLFGYRASFPYRMLFLVFVVLGSIINATNVITFSDLMLLSMAFPNMLGLYLLSNKVKRSLNVYWAARTSGDFSTIPKKP